VNNDIEIGEVVGLDAFGKLCKLPKYTWWSKLWQKPNPHAKAVGIVACFIGKDVKVITFEGIEYIMVYNRVNKPQKRGLFGLFTTMLVKYYDKIYKGI